MENPINLQMLEALKDSLGESDISEGVCVFCGRDYSTEQEVENLDEAPLLCTSDDCPGFKARQIVARAEQAKDEEQTHIVITGNVIDGCAFIGPFSDYDSALKWAEDLPPVDDWHVAVLDKPEDGPRMTKETPPNTYVETKDDPAAQRFLCPAHGDSACDECLQCNDCGKWADEDEEWDTERSFITCPECVERSKGRRE